MCLLVSGAHLCCHESRRPQQAPLQGCVPLAKLHILASKGQQGPVACRLHDTTPVVWFSMLACQYASQLHPNHILACSIETVAFCPQVHL